MRWWIPPFAVFGYLRHLRKKDPETYNEVIESITEEDDEDDDFSELSSVLEKGINELVDTFFDDSDDDDEEEDF